MSYPLSRVAFPRLGLVASVRSSFAHWGALLWRALLLQGQPTGRSSRPATPLRRG